MPKLKWERPYVGPFKKSEAEALVADIKKIANPEMNGIHDARIRKSRKYSKCVCTAACGAGLGHNEKYDVYIKSEVLS